MQPGMIPSSLLRSSLINFFPQTPACPTRQDVAATEADKIVKIIDNGGVPFIVRISYQRKVATVLKSPAFGLPPTDATEVLLTLAFERAFVGLDLPERKVGDRIVGVGERTHRGRIQKVGAGLVLAWPGPGPSSPCCGRGGPLGVVGVVLCPDQKLSPGGDPTYPNVQNPYC